MLPLTTARRRLGTLVFASRQPAAYEAADAGFLQLVANQVAVAVENALAFQEIEAALREIQALKDKLAKENAYLEEEVRTEHNFGEIVGESPALRRVLKQVETVAPTGSTVLIRGETGTGKELIARALHELSPRRDRTFVKLNCAAIPTGLLESELFGHEKGAFTGAIGQKVGRFELAHQGTLFLDEVGDIPPELQPKLLRVLQEQEFERLGGTRTIKVDVRLVAATNRDLARMVADGRFREDLYYRLNVFPLVLPPLRERPEDIPRLVRHFTQRFARRMGRRIETIPSAVMEALVRYPGRATSASCRTSSSGRSSSRRARRSGSPSAICSPPPRGPGRRPLRRAHWPTPNGTTSWASCATPGGWGGPNGAAARLGMKRTTLQLKMKKLGISRRARDGMSAVAEEPALPLRHSSPSSRPSRLIRPQLLLRCPEVPRRNEKISASPVRPLL